MPRWGLVVEQNLGFGRQHRVWSAEVIAQVDGTREEALVALRQRAENFEPVHPASPKRRALYRSQDGFLLVLSGAMQDFHCRFTLAELLFDSGAPEPGSAPEARAEPGPEPEPVRAAVRRSPKRPPEPEPARPWDADVPEVPSWLGREGLS